MKETTLTIIRYACFIVGIGSGFTSIYLQETDHTNIAIISILAIIMAVSLAFFSMGFIFIDIEKAQQSIDDALGNKN